MYAFSAGVVPVRVDMPGSSPGRAVGAAAVGRSLSGPGSRGAGRSTETRVGTGHLIPHVEQAASNAPAGKTTLWLHRGQGKANRVDSRCCGWVGRSARGAVSASGAWAITFLC